MPCFDVYSERRSPPADWPDVAKRWACKLTGDGIITYATEAGGVRLSGALSDANALSCWMPLEFYRCLREDQTGWDSRARPEVAGAPGVIIVWIDGAVHEGVAPQRPGDLLHLYRVARLELEAWFSDGVRAALDGWDSPHGGSRMN